MLHECSCLCSIDLSFKCQQKCIIALQEKEKNNFESADNNLIDGNSTLMAVGSLITSVSILTR